MIQQIVKIPELPDELTQVSRDRIRQFAVSLIMTNLDGDDSKAVPCSGTLVTVKGRPALLTADHVWEAARQRPVLAIMANGKFVRMKTAEIPTVRFNSSERIPETIARTPDICLVYLPQSVHQVLEARGKCFYSIDRRMDAEEFQLQANDGYYVAVGCPKALMDHDKGIVGSMLYITQVDRYLSLGVWDFVYVNLNIEGNPLIPETFEGVSGGGLWRVRFQMTEDRSQFWIEDPSRDIMLVGVNFFQTGAPGSQLIAHGPGSIYETMMK